MSEDPKYTLWLKPSASAFDKNSATERLLQFEGVTDAQFSEIEMSGVSRREALLAVTLSVTANFATDGIKAVVELLTEESNATIVMCRRPDGQDVPLESIINTDGPK